MTESTNHSDTPTAATAFGRREIADMAMSQALVQALGAQHDGDVPVGAVVVDEQGAVIGRGRNRREAHGDPLAHAEVEALREAATSRGGWRLRDCTLVVTLEPCPMCAGACVQSQVGAVVFGAWDAKMGSCGSVWDIPRDPHIGSAPQVWGGVREQECSQVLTDFFQGRRSQEA